MAADTVGILLDVSNPGLWMALPHRRTRRQRHDVQLQRDPRAGAGLMSIPSPDRPPLDVLVIGGGQAGLAMGQQLNLRGRPLRDHRRRPRDRPCVALTLGLAATVHLRALRQPAGAGLRGSIRQLPRQGRRGQVPAGLRHPVRAAGAAGHDRHLPNQDRRRVRREGRPEGVRGPAGGAGHRSLCRSPHRARRSSPPTSTRSTAATTGVPATSRPGGSWSSVPRTRGARSPWNSPRHATSTCRSASGSPRFLNGR
jgi:hypothetical protein